MRWVLSILRAFQCENTPSKRPILALLQRNAKTKSANYININTLHFCILQFTFVLHPLVFLRSILLLICLTCYNIAYVDGIYREYEKSNLGSEMSF